MNELNGSRGLNAYKLGIACVAFLILFSSCNSPEQATAEQARAEQALPQTGGDVAFIHVNVIPMDSETVLEDRTVVITDGRISHMGPARETRLSADVTVIDGTGKFLLPGLADMHVHIWSDKEPPLYVANGVTAVRNMWGSEGTLELRSKIAAGDVLGPTIITAGPLIDGSPRIWDGSVEVSDPEAARQIVRDQHAAGYDFIKVYSNLAPEVFYAIADEAKKLGIPFSGHIPRSMEAADAMRAGMASVEHLTGHKAAATNAGYSVGNGFRSQEMEDIANRVNAGEITMDDVFSVEKMQELGEVAKESGTWQSATLVVIDRIFLTSEQSNAHFARPEMRYMSPSIRSFWNPENDFRRRDVTEEQMIAMQQFHKVDMKQVGALHAAGAGILAGTDAPNPFVLHGFAIYDELEFLHEAGLSRYEAIAAATRNPAIFLEAEGEFGTVRTGARADLILLDANPLEDLDNFAGRQGVMLRGQWMPQADLDAALEKVAAFYDQPDWFEGREDLSLVAGAEVRSQLEYKLVADDQNLGGERMAVQAGVHGGLTVVAQNAIAMSIVRTQSSYLLETDADGLLLNYEFSLSTELEKVSASLTKTKDAHQTDAYQLVTAAGQEVISSDRRVLSGTLADWVMLAAELGLMDEGQKITLEVLAPPPTDPTIWVPQSWMIIRRENTAEVASTGMIDLQVFDVEVELEGGAMSVEVRLDHLKSMLHSVSYTSAMGTMSFVPVDQ